VNPEVDRRVVPGALALTVLVSVGDYLTGAEVTFTLLYLGPIALAAYYRGRLFGAIVSLLATAGGVTAQLAEVLRDRHSVTRTALPILVWNQGGALGIFLVLVQLVASLRKHIDREREERQRVVQRLRHSERLNALGVFAAGVAHELGTPLAVVGGSAELIGREGTSRAGARALAQTIREQVARMEAIVHQVLDFGRPGAPRDTPVDLAGTCREVVELLGPITRRRGSTLRLATEPAVVIGDARELTQVVSNLVMNALQATPGGGEVAVIVTSRAGEAELRVEDHGVGIAPADLPRVFDPFFTTKDVDEGTGLGLSVSFGIVREHGGRIEVASALGQGSTFSVRLPLAEVALARAG